MEFALSPQQYRKLIELAYLGEWVINAHHAEDHQDEEATKLLQHLMSSVAIDGVETDPETGRRYLTAEWDGKLQDHIIADYDDHTFWEELTERLAERDLSRQQGRRVEDIDHDDDLLELKPIEDRYRRTFEANGLEGVHLDTELP